MRLTLGIDIGVDGAVAVIDDAGNFVEVFDLPTMEGAIGKKARRVINGLALRDMLRDRMAIGHTFKAYIERIHAMPMNGAIATFSQGHSLATVTTVLACLGIPCQLIPPNEWKKAAGLSKADKDASRTAAIQWYPSAAPYLERKKDHNRGEAILIARYGRSLS